MYFTKQKIITFMQLFPKCRKLLNNCTKPLKKLQNKYHKYIYIYFCVSLNIN